MASDGWTMLSNAMSIIEVAVVESKNIENANCDMHLTLYKSHFGTLW